MAAKKTESYGSGKSGKKTQKKKPKTDSMPPQRNRFVGDDRDFK